MKEDCQYHGRGGDFHYIDRAAAINWPFFHMPQARFVCFEENGHFVPMENPQEVALAILDFIKSV